MEWNNLLHDVLRNSWDWGFANLNKNATTQPFQDLYAILTCKGSTTMYNTQSIVVFLVRI